MSPTAILFIVVAAFAHAGWNLAAKRAGNGGALFVWLNAALTVVLIVPIAVIVVLLGGQQPTWAWLPALGVSGLLHVSYFVLLQRGYAVGDMSVVYPLARGTGPLLSVLLAVVLLGERPGVVALLGASAVVAGVFVIGTAHGATDGSQRTWASVGFGVATGLTIAGYTLWDANAVTTLHVPPIAQLAGSIVVQALALLPVAVARRDRIGELWHAHKWNAAVIAVLSPLAYVLVLYALRIAPVALVAPARELSIVIGSVIAWRVLHEPKPVRRLTGAAIVLAGVFALAVA